MFAFAGRNHARDIVGFARVLVGAMVVAGLGCFQTLLRPAGAMTAPTLTAVGAIALIAAFAGAVGLAIFAAAADVDGPARRNFPRRPPHHP